MYMICACIYICMLICMYYMYTTGMSHGDPG